MISLFVLCFGTRWLYLCINKMRYKHLKQTVMNTNISLSSLSSMFSSEDSFRTFVDMVNEMDLELMDVTLA